VKINITVCADVFYVPIPVLLRVNTQIHNKANQLTLSIKLALTGPLLTSRSSEPWSWGHWAG